MRRRAHDLAQLAPSQKKTTKAAKRTTTAEKEEMASLSFVPAAEEEDLSFIVAARCRHRSSGHRRAKGLQIHYDMAGANGTGKCRSTDRLTPIRTCNGGQPTRSRMTSSSEGCPNNYRRLGSYFGALF